jgi:hypothetical protein
MQTRLNTHLTVLLAAAAFIVGCTTNPVPEEEFTGPDGNFPCLIDVPDRPKLPKIKPDKISKELEERNKESNKIKELTAPSGVAPAP